MHLRAFKLKLLKKKWRFKLFKLHLKYILKNMIKTFSISNLMQLFDRILNSLIDSLYKSYHLIIFAKNLFQNFYFKVQTKSFSKISFDIWNWQNYFQINTFYSINVSDRCIYHIHKISISSYCFKSKMVTESNKK